LLEDVKSVVAMAVDPFKGYLFLADKTTVKRHLFRVNLG